MNLSKPQRRVQGIRMRAKDQSIVYARSLEFEPDTSPEIVFIPRGHFFTAIGPNGSKSGLSWQSRYALAGIDGAGKKILMEGVNEKGLAAGLFFLPGRIEAPGDSGPEAHGSISFVDLAAWVLSNCATVKEVKQALPGLWINQGISVWPSPGPVPLYYTIHDRLGNHLVIGHAGGKLHLFSTPAKTFSDSPAFDWHMTHSGHTAKWQQTGALSTNSSPSCFIRVAARSLSGMPLNTAEEAVLQAFCILHSTSGNEPKRKMIRTCVNDLENGRFFFYTTDKQQIQVVDLMKMDLDSGEVLRFNL